MGNDHTTCQAEKQLIHLSNQVDNLTKALLGDEFRKDGMIAVVDRISERLDEYEERNDKRVNAIEKKSWWLSGAAGGVGWILGIISSTLWK